MSKEQCRCPICGVLFPVQRCSGAAFGGCPEGHYSAGNHIQGSYVIVCGKNFPFSSVYQSVEENDAFRKLADEVIATAKAEWEKKKSV